MSKTYVIDEENEEGCFEFWIQNTECFAKFLPQISMLKNKNKELTRPAALSLKWTLVNLPEPPLEMYTAPPCSPLNVKVK